MPETTIRHLLRTTTALLRTAGVPSPELDAGLILAHVLDVERFRLALEPNRRVTDDQMSRFRGLVSQRVERRPISHLLGHAEFWSMSFMVTDATLAPRPETEMLVEEAARFVRDLDAPVVVDVGTGTGCIPIALAAESKTAYLHAVDLSVDALSIARANAARHGVELRIEFHLGDLLTPLQGTVAPAGADIVISNPPYVRHDEVDDVDPEVLWEPQSAVFCEGDPVDLYVEIARQAAPYVRPDGLLLLELPGDDPVRVSAGIMGLGAWGDISVHADLAGKPRMLRAVRLASAALDR